MRTLYSHCPNQKCRYHTEEAPPRWYWKRGYFDGREPGQRIPRYQCKMCRHWFSSNTFKTTYRQKRPDINDVLTANLIEGMGVRPASRAIKVSKTTILKRIKDLGQLAEQVCREKLQSGAIRTSYVQFDEMMAFERTQCLPITIAVAVRAKTGEIVSLRAGRIPCETGLRDVSRRKYGYRENHREQTVRQMLRDVALVMKDRGFTIASDSKLDYRDWIEKELPDADYQKFSGEDLKRREKAMKTVDLNLEPIDFSLTNNSGEFIIKRQKNGKIVKKAYDPLFTVNQKCMKLRASLSRLRRDYWGHSQTLKYLQYHLWIFMCLHNGWDIPTRKPKPLPNHEPKVFLTPDIVGIEPLRSDLLTVTASINRRNRNILVLPVMFMRQHGLLQKKFYKACFDPVNQMMSLTFHSDATDGAIPFPLANENGHLALGFYLRRNDLRLREAGRVQVQWNETRQCAFVALGGILERKEM